MREITPERYALIALSHIAEPGDRALMSAVAGVGPEAALSIIDSPTYNTWTSAAKELRERLRPRTNHAQIQQSIQRAVDAGIDAIIPGDAEWPIRVDTLGEIAPLVLWTRGDATLLDADRTLAVVGARAATSYGEHITGEITSDLARDHVIVSGAAYGIDGQAHRATLRTDGKTIAVLASGGDRVYPAGHSELIAKIAETGLVVSEMPPGFSPTKWRFLARNRIIAALGDATLVVEAGMRSGSLNTAGHARNLDRPVGAVPGPLTSAASAGCHRLIRESGATLITSASDVRALIEGEIQ